MRVLGLDLGSKTIGLAVSDAMKSIAQPYDVIIRENTEKDLSRIQKVVLEKEVDVIVVGLPYNMDGSEGASASKAREFADMLKSLTGLNIILYDERMTTLSAERSMLEGDLSRAKRKKRVDKVAAAFILQGYLDSQTK